MNVSTNKEYRPSVRSLNIERLSTVKKLKLMERKCDLGGSVEEREPFKVQSLSKVFNIINCFLYIIYSKKRISKLKNKL